MAVEQFSVLMSVYFREKPEYLDQSLASLFEQTVSPDEVVLVEDGPLNPGLDSVIECYRMRYPQLRIVKLAENMGLGAALNEGLRYCSHELVARMDSDDICVSDRFERQLSIFRTHPEYDIIGGWIDEFSHDPQQLDSIRKLPETHAALQRFFQSRSPMNHVSVMFRRSVVLEAGGYQSFYLLEDYWLWGRMLHRGARFYNIPAVLVHVRGGQAMTARRGGWKYAKSEIRLQREFLRMKLISPVIYYKNILVRSVVRLMPNKLRTFIYQRLLRK